MKDSLDYDSWLYERGHDSLPVGRIIQLEKPSTTSKWDTTLLRYDHDPVIVPPLEIDTPLARYLETKIKDAIHQSVG